MCYNAIQFFELLPSYKPKTTWQITSQMYLLEELSANKFTPLSILLRAVNTLMDVLPGESCPVPTRWTSDDLKKGVFTNSQDTMSYSLTSRQLTQQKREHSKLCFIFITVGILK